MSSSQANIAPNALDHVALWVSDRERLAAFLCQYLGMHEIDHTDKFTLVGADARRGKLTLFDAKGDREPGQLRRVVLRVADPGRVLAQLPSNLDVTEADDGVWEFTGPLGPRPIEPASQFLRRHGALPGAPADPNKVPYYLHGGRAAAVAPAANQESDPCRSKKSPTRPSPIT